MTDVNDLRNQLADAYADAETHCAPYGAAVDESNAAKRRAAELRQHAEKTPRILGIFPGRASRVLITEAEKAEAQAAEASERARSLSSKAAEVGLRVHDLERQVEAAEAALEAEVEADDLVFADLNRENQRSALAAQRVHDAVESDQLTVEGAYADDGLIRTEVYDRALRQLEADDGLFYGWEDPEAAESAQEGEIEAGEDEGPTGSTDDGYAEAEADARADQLEVMYLDRSIDTGERTYQEVYTPEGHIRQHLLSGEEPEQETERAQEPEPARERDRSDGFDIEEPF